MHAFPCWPKVNRLTPIELKGNKKKYERVHFKWIYRIYGTFDSSNWLSSLCFIKQWLNMNPFSAANVRTKIYSDCLFVISIECKFPNQYIYSKWGGTFKRRWILLPIYLKFEKKMEEKENNNVKFRFTQAHWTTTAIRFSKVRIKIWLN